MHDKPSCWAAGLKEALARALKAELGADDRARLEEFINTLPKEAETNG